MDSSSSEKQLSDSRSKSSKGHVRKRNNTLLQKMRPATHVISKDVHRQYSGQLPSIAEHSHSSGQQTYSLAQNASSNNEAHAPFVVKDGQSQRSNSIFKMSQELRANLSKSDLYQQKGPDDDGSEISAQEIQFSMPRINSIQQRMSEKQLPSILEQPMQEQPSIQEQPSVQEQPIQENPSRDVILSQNLSQKQPSDHSKLQKRQALDSGPDESTLGSKINETFNFGFKSRKLFLQSISYKRLKSLKKSLFTLCIALYFAESLMRSIIVQVHAEDSFQPWTLIQQLLCWPLFLFLFYFTRLRKLCGKVPIYIILQIILMLVQPFDAQSLNHQLQSTCNYILMQVCFMVAYCPMFELVIPVVWLLTLNAKLRSAFYRQQERFSQYQTLEWYDHLIDACLIGSVGLVFFMKAFQVDIITDDFKIVIPKQKRKNSEESDLFDDEKIGVLNCDSFEKQSTTKKILNSLQCGAGLIEANRIVLREPSEDQHLMSPNRHHSKRMMMASPSPFKQLLNQYKSDEPFVAINQQLKDILQSLNSALEYGLDTQVFYEYKFDKVPVESNQLNSSGSSGPSPCNEDDISFNTDGGENNVYSLRELIQLLSVEGERGRIFIKASRQVLAQTLVDHEESHSPKNQNRFDRSSKEEPNLCWQPPNKLEQSVDDRNSFVKKACKDAENKAASRSRWIFFELQVRPLYVREKVHYLIQMTQINHVLYRTFRMTKKMCDHLPTDFHSKESFQSINSIVKNSQMIEQVICRLSGFQSRTSILDVNFADEIVLHEEEAGNTNLSKNALARIQFYLSSIWCQSIQMSYRLKSRLSFWMIMNKRLMLNFQKVSKQSISIENHVKQFLLIFSQQIEAKNLHITVSQGTMPDEELYTDWNQYDQILYQILNNAIQHNERNGAISINILFMKEKRNMVTIESKEQTSQILADNFVCHEIGKIVTVVKDSSGIEEEIKKDQDKKNEKFGEALMTARTLTEQLGGKVIVKFKRGCFTQVTFNVQCTMYHVKQFDPIMKKLDSELGLSLPLKNMRRLSDAVQNQHELNSADDKRKSHQQDYQVYRMDLSAISINPQTEEQNSDAEMINCAFKQYNTIQEVLEYADSGNQREAYYQPHQPQNEFFDIELDGDLKSKISSLKELNSIDVNAQSSISQNPNRHRSGSVNDVINLGPRRFTEESKVQQSEQGEGTDSKPISTTKKSSQERKINSLADALRVSQIPKIRSGDRHFRNEEAHSQPKLLDQSPVQLKAPLNPISKRAASVKLQQPDGLSIVRSEIQMLAQPPFSESKDVKEMCNSVNLLPIPNIVPSVDIEEESKNDPAVLSVSYVKKQESLSNSLKIELVENLQQQEADQEQNIKDEIMESEYSLAESEIDRMIEPNSSQSKLILLGNNILSEKQQEYSRLLLGNKGVAMFNSQMIKLENPQHPSNQHLKADFQHGDSLGEERKSVPVPQNNDSDDQIQKQLRLFDKPSLSSANSRKSHPLQCKEIQIIAQDIQYQYSQECSVPSDPKMSKNNVWNYVECRCKRLLVIDSDPETAQKLSDILSSDFPQGAAFAPSEELAQSMLTQQLRSECCKKVYDIVFVSIDSDMVSGLEITKRLKKTVLEWNQQPNTKRRKMPMFVAMKSGDAKNQKSEFDLVVQKNPFSEVQIMMIPQLPEFSQVNFGGNI